MGSGVKAARISSLGDTLRQMAITLRLVYLRGKSAMNNKQERRLPRTAPDVTTKSLLCLSCIENDPVCY